MITRLRRFLGWLGKRVLLKMARFCIYHAHSTRYCWICGRHPGMGPVWAGGRMTCWNCCNEWSPFHNTRKGLIVDWRGLGRKS